jgi:hypothetical protein
VGSAPGAWRRIHLGDDAPEALLISIAGHVEGTSLSDLQDNIDRLKWTLRPRRELTLRWSDTSDREWFGYRHELVIADIPPGLFQKVVRFSASIVCPDPFAHELSQQTKSDPGAAPRVVTPDIGTAPMPVEITIVGNAGANLVNPVLHYRDKNNSDITTLGYTGSLGGSDTLVVDTEYFTAKLNGSSVAANMSGSYFDVDPNHGDYLGSPAGPDIQLTADSGTADTFDVKYYRRYW